MDVSNNLLVALMFVTVLSIGIGNILVSLAAIANPGPKARFHWIPSSWLLLLLLQHLHMFWHTLAILDAAEWGFGGFLYVVAGPMILFLATSVMLPTPVEATSTDTSEHYFNVARRFFAIMAALMLWMVGVDLVLGKGLTSAAIWNAAAVPLLLALGSSQKRRLHATATGIAWVLSLSLLIARSAGWIH